MFLEVTATATNILIKNIHDSVSEKDVWLTEITKNDSSREVSDVKTMTHWLIPVLFPQDDYWDKVTLSIRPFVKSKTYISIITYGL